MAWLTLIATVNAVQASPAVPLDLALEAEARQDWPAALAAYETVYDATRTDQATRAHLWKKFADLRTKVAPNNDTNNAGVWRVKAYVFRELDFSWKDKQGRHHRSRHRYREDEIERLQLGMAAFAAKVWDFTCGSLRIQWALTVVEKPLSRLDGDDSFWPGPDACMAYFTDLKAGQADTIMVFAKVFGDASKGETSAEVPQLLLGGAIGVADPLTKGAT